MFTHLLPLFYQKKNKKDLILILHFDGKKTQTLQLDNQSKLEYFFNPEIMLHLDWGNEIGEGAE